jgi:predicted nuclease of restriction endonuclease-like (RecB) superfamily
LIGVVNDDARVWYEREAAEESWAVRTLQRNKESQYYFRMIKAPNPEDP